MIVTKEHKPPRLRDSFPLIHIILEYNQNPSPGFQTTLKHYEARHVLQGGLVGDHPYYLPSVREGLLEFLKNPYIIVTT